MHKEMRVIMDICAASRAAGLVARPDIAKCHGSIGDLTPKCISCVRILAPEGVGQQYAEPTITGDVCSQYASVERYGHLFVAAPAPHDECAAGMTEKGAATV